MKSLVLRLKKCVSRRQSSLMKPSAQRLKNWIALEHIDMTRKVGDLKTSAGAGRRRGNTLLVKSIRLVSILAVQALARSLSPNQNPQMKAESFREGGSLEVKRRPLENLTTYLSCLIVIEMAKSASLSSIHLSVKWIKMKITQFLLMN